MEHEDGPLTKQWTNTGNQWSLRGNRKRGTDVCFWFRQFLYVWLTVSASIPTRFVHFWCVDSYYFHPFYFFFFFRIKVKIMLISCGKNTALWVTQFIKPFSTHYPPTHPPNHASIQTHTDRPAWCLFISNEAEQNQH